MQTDATNSNDHCIICFTCYIISKLEYLLIFQYYPLTLLTCQANILQIWQLATWLWRAVQTLYKVCCLWKSDAMTCNAMTCNAMTCNAMTCNAMTCNAMTCNTMTCNALTCNALTYNAMPCNAMTCNALIRNGMTCHAMTCNAVQWHTMQLPCGGLSVHPPILWWLSHGEGRDAITWCGWDKL